MNLLRNKKIYLFLFSFIALVIIIVNQTTNKQHAPVTESTRKITLGAWTEGLFDPSTQELHPGKLLAFENLIQKKVSIAHYYRGWESLADPDLISEFATLRSNGWIPMLSANPYYFSQCPASELPLYKAIAQGNCDKFIHKAGKNLSKIKQPFYLVFAWEMNNKDLEWSIPHSGSSTSDFIAAWRHIHTILKQENATNVRWVFCPNVPNDPNIPYNKLYPGDNFVDWTGLDGYNWGTTQSWSQWASFAGVFTASYKQLTSIAPDKPLMLAEVNSTDQGGDKGAWYTDMLTQQLPYHFPKIAAIVVFNEDKSSQEHVNWKIDKTPDSLHAFIAGIHTSFYE